MQGQEARQEQGRRKEGRREAGLEGEKHWQQYLTTVQAGQLGLKNRENLEARASLLERSLAKDSQVLPVAHLAKTLVMMGKFERAEREMAKWGKWQKTKEKNQRWKKASVQLELFKIQRKNPEASLKSAQWKAARKAKVDQKEVEELTRKALAQPDQPLFLFDEEDERLVQSGLRGSIVEN